MVSVSSSLATDVARGEVGVDHIITVTRNAFVYLVLSGAVVGAPGADNLKIRPEFLPGIVSPMYILKPSFPRQAVIHTVSWHYVWSADASYGRW